MVLMAGHTPRRSARFDVAFAPKHVSSAQERGQAQRRADIARPELEEKALDGVLSILRAFVGLRCGLPSSEPKIRVSAQREHRSATSTPDVVPASKPF